MLPDNTALPRILRDIRTTLDHLRRSGCTGFDCGPRTLETLKGLGLPPRRPGGPAGESLADI
ncbi:MAG TPA: hypothetical protein VLT88_13035, partial [Desulfosarcina sp.]|nr:hypothetical protein [Desulfosarcina sp.]